jgi:hypothetical protein
VAEGSWPPAYEKGQAVTVLYDLGPPVTARIASRSGTIAQWLLPGITGLVGIAFLIATLLAVWITRPSPSQALKDSTSNKATPRD